jgi:hypothetical protein
MSNAHQPGSQPISIPEQISNPAVQPKCRTRNRCPTSNTPNVPQYKDHSGKRSYLRRRLSVRQKPHAARPNLFEAVTALRQTTFFPASTSLRAQHGVIERRGNGTSCLAWQWGV